MPLPTEADRPALLVAIQCYLATGGDPTDGLVTGALLNKWWRTELYEPQAIYVATRTLHKKWVVEVTPTVARGPT